MLCKQYKVYHFLILVFFITMITACSTNENQAKEIISKSEKTQRIQRYPTPQNLKRIMDAEKLKELPKYDSQNPNGILIDLRSRDISQLDLTNNLDELLHSFFDTDTIWTKALPKDFSAEQIMDLNKNPNLNIESLHNQGITGKGISVGIIDYGLLINHIEYKENIKVYEEIHYKGPDAHFHGPSVTSILAGKNLGVAPEAEVYFIGCENFDYQGDIPINQSYVAQSINRLLEINEGLPKDKKLKLISISGAWQPKTKGYEEMNVAIKKANKQGIFVISANLFEYNSKFHFRGLTREALDDPNKYESYGVYKWDQWMSLVDHIDSFDKYYEEQYKKIKNKQILLIPIDARTTASANGDEDYVYFSRGGWSWAVPFLSGLYALCCQANPDTTPEKFWKSAYETGIMREFDDNGVSNFGKIINPEKLIEDIKSK